MAAPETTLARRIVVSVYKGTSMLTVAAKAPDPDQAAALANGVAHSIIEQNTIEVVRLFRPARDNLEKELTALSTTMAQELQALQKSPNGSAAFAAHQNTLTGLQTQYTATFTREQDIAQQQDRLSNLATLLQPAQPPASPEAPTPARYLLAALIAGLAVGVVAALLVERFGGRIQSAEGLARAAAIPVALVAPRLNGHPAAADHRPYALALASLLSRPPDARPVLVMAASVHDHSDAVAASLGAVAAQSGQRAVVIQADGHAADADYVQPDVVGLTTVAASDNGVGAARAVAAVRKQYDFESADTLVLVSVPSPDISPTAILLGQSTGRAVLTATAGVTRYRDARRTAELLQRSGIEVVVGIVLARRPLRLFR
jgi:capsular polysaccharide biosynthesis protein